MKSKAEGVDDTEVLGLGVRKDEEAFGGEREKRNSLPGKEVSQQRKRGSRHRRGGNSQRLPENNENHVSGSVSSFTWLLGSSSQILRSASKTV